ncbi:unnamed protein product, partial [Laminaria digitata]
APHTGIAHARATQQSCCNCYCCKLRSLLPYQIFTLGQSSRNISSRIVQEARNCCREEHIGANSAASNSCGEAGLLLVGGRGPASRDTRSLSEGARRTTMMSENRQIGTGLLALGGIFLFLGMLLFFDPGLLAIG